MSQPYEMQSLATIRAWLASLLVRGAKLGPRPGPSMDGIARHTGIPINTLKWLVYNDNAVSLARQRLLSRVMAQVENGQLVFEFKGARGKVGRYVTESPRPIARYGFTFGPGGPRLAARDRPAPFRGMPSFKDVLLK